MPDPDTKALILDTAERLFAVQGIAATSLRTITSEAGVNLAAVHYHFGSKDGLVRAVFARRLDALNAERLRLLDDLEAAAGDGPIDLEPLLCAFLGPVLRLGLDPERGETLKRLFGRLYSEPSEVVETIIGEQFAGIARRFIPAFGRALPDLPEVELFWRLHFSIGTMAQTCLDTHRLRLISGGRCDPSDSEGTVERMVSFLAPGLRAPIPEGAGAAAAARGGPR